MNWRENGCSFYLWVWCALFVEYHRSKRHCQNEKLNLSPETNTFLLYLTLKKVGPSVAQKIVSKCKNNLIVFFLLNAWVMLRCEILINMISKYMFLFQSIASPKFWMSELNISIGFVQRKNGIRIRPQPKFYKGVNE